MRNKFEDLVIPYLFLFVFLILGNIQLYRAVTDLPNFTHHMGYWLFWYICGFVSYAVIIKNADKYE